MQFLYTTMDAWPPLAPQGTRIGLACGTLVMVRIKFRSWRNLCEKFALGGFALLTLSFLKMTPVVSERNGRLSEFCGTPIRPASLDEEALRRARQRASDMWEIEYRTRGCNTRSEFLTQMLCAMKGK